MAKATKKTKNAKTKQRAQAHSERSEEAVPAFTESDPELRKRIAAGPATYPEVKPGEQKVRIKRCPRCELEHDILTKPLKKPTGDWDRWGMCETVDEPVFFRTLPGPGEQITKVVNNEALEDMARAMDRKVLGDMDAVIGRPTFTACVEALLLHLVLYEIPLAKMENAIALARVEAADPKDRLGETGTHVRGYVRVLADRLLR